ncbi:hypothetical protein CCUS01_12683, partial [Colletotrichum cuscutae]
CVSSSYSFSLRCSSAASTPSCVSRSAAQRLTRTHLVLMGDVSGCRTAVPRIRMAATSCAATSVAGLVEDGWRTAPTAIAIVRRETIGAQFTFIPIAYLLLNNTNRTCFGSIVQSRLRECTIITKSPCCAHAFLPRRSLDALCS